MKAPRQIPIEDMKEGLSYNQVTGHFAWVFDHQHIRSGERAGFLSQDGYWVIKWNDKSYKAHRIAWAWVHGDNGSQIDHINGVRWDNRINNLRLASNSQNCMNRRKSISNTSGFKGVTKSNQGGLKVWHARIKIKGVSISLGHFRTPEEASYAYQNASVKYHGEFAYVISQAHNNNAPSKLIAHA
jgi:hypothetical protein